MPNSDDIKPATRQVNWRIRVDCIEAAKQEAKQTGFSTITSLLNNILFTRYFNKEKGE